MAKVPFDLCVVVDETPLAARPEFETPNKYWDKMSPSVIRILLLLLVVCGVAGAAAYTRNTPAKTAGPEVMTHSISKGLLEVTVTENGTVESSNNKEIKCMVKGGSTVLWVIETGTIVEPGDVLVRLDQSQIEDNILAKQITYENALANKITAESNVAVAEKSIVEYLEGTYVEERRTIEKEIFDAKQAVTQAKLKRESAQRMVAKGLLKSLQLEQEQFQLESAEKDLEVKQTKLVTLDKYKKEKELQTLRSNLKVAEAQLASYEASLQLEKTRLEREKEQLVNCTIEAEVGGMVIFPSMAEWKETPDIEEGAVVREQQTLLVIPDPTKMQVKVGIHESKVDRLKLGMTTRVELQGTVLAGEVAEIAEVTRPAGWWTGNLVKYDTIIRLPEDEALKPGMSAMVDVVLARYEDVVIIPVAAVLEQDGEYSCWVKTESGFEQRALELGDTNDEFNVVTSGLTEGDEVALNPTAFIEEAKRKALAPTGDSDQVAGDEVQGAESAKGESKEVVKKKSAGK
ncbi:MAG: HlyD family efflux transporter periplasmic adaptor subunit [Planctomycetota bacterium]